MKSNNCFANLSERQLLYRFAGLVRGDRRHTAKLLLALTEIDERKLWAKHGSASMFAFCVERFHMSESVTAKRIWAARTARRFPVILPMIARGDLHLSAIAQLARHLTEENHRSVLARARHKSSREVHRLVAELDPKPDVPSRIRALPRRAGDSARSQPQPPRPAPSADSERSVIARACAPTGYETTAKVRTPTAFNASVAPRPHKQIVALAPRRYKIEITVDQETHDKLRTLEDLLGHALPGADPAAIVSRAIDRLLTETLKKKAALTDRRRSSDLSSDHVPAAPEARRTRAIPAAIRRAVWLRDGGRCTFIDPRGSRCRATRCIEYHHDRPYGKGGQHDASNIALLCRAHNQYQADLDFGKELMGSKRRRDSIIGSPHSARNA